MLTTTSFAGGTGKSRTPRSWKSVLLVTSHPDDESMFFGPTIQAAKRMGAQVHILCLSTGDADGLGEVRAKELDSAGAYFGVTSVELVDDSALRDGFDEKWPVEAVAARVDAAASKVGAETVVTFDAGGVSGHPNHTATYRGVLYWMLSEDYRETLRGVRQVWSLVTTNTVRKFAGVCDAFASFFLEPNAMLAASNPLALMRAMTMHASQFVWYRRLFVVFSRYSYTNTLKCLKG